MNWDILHEVKFQYRKTKVKVNKNIRKDNVMYHRFDIKIDPNFDYKIRLNDEEMKNEIFNVNFKISCEHHKPDLYEGDVFS